MAHQNKPLNPSGNQKSGSENGYTLSPSDIKAVDELCHVLARVLMRVKAEEEAQSSKGDVA